MKNHILAISLGCLVCSTAVLAQDKAEMKPNAPMAMSSATTHMDDSSMMSSKDASKAPYDLQFLDTMGMHHQSAVEMAKLAEDRSEHAELKAMAKKMISDQQGEISQMKSWREQWYPGKSQAMNMEMPGMMDSMKGMSMPKLAASKGKEFDSMFLDMMIKHHAGAVKMAKSAEAKAQHPEIKDLSKKMVSAQLDEITQMKKWKVQWKLAGS
ncbi:DUF305 domain-containing protein [Duganella sacchari]|nr:DUF305 domain-containing protein [Duganella sacchari]